ncbi:MAG: helix-turn-helix domain-containing protein [Paracoccaceae bacterium]|nr:helix-turn-helix domain-containing protein [Paracoccaceae bacterium]
MQRATIILHLGDGLTLSQTMSATGMSKPTVRRWWDRFLEEGVDGLLYDISRRRGRKPISKDKVSELIALVMSPPPAHASHWTLRVLAKKLGIAVSTVIAGLDFNEVSLQFAAAQLTAGNSDIAYRKMQLHRMPYGPLGDRVRVGSLDLLGQSPIVPRSGQMDLGDVSLDSVQMQMSYDDPVLENATNAAKNDRIVIMNPPFTNRSRMGEKFPAQTQKAMRQRADALEAEFVRNDPEMEGFTDKNSIRPLFVALADKCLNSGDGVLAMINPTIALTATSGRHERVVLAGRFHIHTLLICHQPGQINLSQNTAINESMIIAKRHEGARPPMRIICVDRFPLDEREAAELHRCIADCTTGLLPNGWGEVSEWPVERIEAGDWSAAVFRSPELAGAAARIANDEKLLPIIDQKFVPSAVLQGGAQMSVLAKSNADTPGSFPVLYYKGAEAQTRITGMPDIRLVSTKQIRSDSLGLSGGQDSHHTEKLLQNAGHLLVSDGQDTSAARLTAVASDVKYVGVGWMPVPGITFERAKAAAVFLNSTSGWLQLMQNPGKKLTFPRYRPGSYEGIRIPDLADGKATSALATCWDRIRDGTDSHMGTISGISASSWFCRYGPRIFHAASKRSDITNARNERVASPPDMLQVMSDPCAAP